MFLFMAAFYMDDVSQGFKDVSTARRDICADLRETFKVVASKWKMTICKDGVSIRLQNDLINFERDSAKLSSDFQKVLNVFIPKLFGVLWRHRPSVSELRIEGHTDSSTLLAPRPGYIYNTKLSQERSRNVLSYALRLFENGRGMPDAEKYIQWSFENVTAHGLSSSTPVKINGRVSPDASRRVEFRIKTVAESDLLSRGSEAYGIEK